MNVCALTVNSTFSFSFFFDLTFSFYFTQNEIGSPHHWFSTQRRILLQHAQQEAGGGSDGNHSSSGTVGTKLFLPFDVDKEREEIAAFSPWDFNVVVESGNGGGKTRFVELATQFLAAYGILENSDLVKKSIDDLRGGKWDDADAAKQRAAAAMADAREKCGGLMVRHAEALAPSNSVASSGNNTPDLRVTAAVLTTEATSLGFVALSCAAGTARSVLSSNPSLEARFPHIVKIDVPTPEDLSIVAQRYCEKERSVQFSSVLKEKIVEHIREQFDGLSGMKFARMIVDNALRKRAERRSKVAAQMAEHQGEKKEEVCDVQEICLSSPLLLPVDFEIGKELGDLEERRRIYKEVEELIGMEPAKTWLRKTRRQIDLANKTKDRKGLKKCYNLVLTGRPGTGKTTFARLVHRFFKAHGILDGEFVEKNALELKGEYVGSTTPMVKACFQEAKGGTLFLDEAYGLANDSHGNGGDSFSKEAIRTLLTEVENNRTGTLVILAGYEDKMKVLLRADPGLPRRFPHTIHLENYTTHELSRIAMHVAQSRFSRDFEPGLTEKLSEHIKLQHSKDIGEQNGGLSVNLVESAVTNQEDRIMLELEQLKANDDGNNHIADGNHSDNEFKNTEEAEKAILSQRGTLKEIDFDISNVAEIGGSEEEKAAVEAELASLIGMKNVKKFFHRMRDTAQFVQLTGKTEALGGCLHLVLTGNPGTGKTTTARLIARYLKAFGGKFSWFFFPYILRYFLLFLCLFFPHTFYTHYACPLSRLHSSFRAVLKSGHFQEVNGLHLKGQYVGQTAHRVSSIVRDSIGGCLFVDEAYSLASNGGDAFGREVIRTLLTEVENHRTDLLVILAGYEEPMEDLLDADPGLRSRFSTRLHLEDYAPKEIAEIAEATATKKTFHFEQTLLDTLTQQIESDYAPLQIAQENGRMAVNLVERAIERMATRLVNSGLSVEDICAAQSTLTAADFIAPKMEKSNSAGRVRATAAMPRGRLRQSEKHTVRLLRPPNHHTTYTSFPSSRRDLNHGGAVVEPLRGAFERYDDGMTFDPRDKHDKQDKYDVMCDPHAPSPSPSPPNEKQKTERVRPHRVRGSGEDGDEERKFNVLCGSIFDLVYNVLLIDVVVHSS